MAVPFILSIRAGVAIAGLDVLNRRVPNTVVVSVRAIGIMCASVAPIAGEDVVEIEHGNIVKGIFIQPGIDQPIVKGARIGGIGGIGAACRQGGCGYDDKELSLPGGKIGQEIIINALGIGNGVKLGSTILTP